MTKSKDTQMIILDARLRAAGFITNPDYRDAFGVDVFAASKALAEMVDGKLLVKEGQKRGTKYRAGPSWPTFDQRKKKDPEPAEKPVDKPKTPVLRVVKPEPPKPEPEPPPVVEVAVEPPPQVIPISSARRKITEADLRRANVGKSFWSARTDRIQVPEVVELIKRYRKNIVKMVGTGSGLLISGPIGVGKTCVAICALKESLSAGLSSYFVTHAEMKELRFEKVPSLYGSGADGITVKRYIETAKLLVLDGFNDTFFTDNVFGPNQLEELIMRRSSDKLTTIMTTRNPEMLKEDKFKALFDIVTQCMVRVPIAGRNMRDDIRKELADRINGDG